MIGSVAISSSAFPAAGSSSGNKPEIAFVPEGGFKCSAKISAVCCARKIPE